MIMTPYRKLMRGLPKISFWARISTNAGKLFLLILLLSSVLHLLSLIGFLGYMHSSELHLDSAWGRGFPSTPSLENITSAVRTQQAGAETVSSTASSSVLVDLVPRTGKPLTAKEIAIEVEATHPNFPFTLWLSAENSSMDKDAVGKNKSCARMPSLYNIAFNNIYWQILKTTNKGTYYLYSAFYDNRYLVERKPVIRVLGMIDRVIVGSAGIHCQLWFGNDSSGGQLVVPVEEYHHIWRCRNWGHCEPGELHPYLMGCRIPIDSVYHNRVPQAVSLVDNPCDTAVNMLRITHNVNNAPNGIKRDFAVCVRNLNFFHLDMSARLVEWIELLKILGADKIFMHKMAVHPNASKVLRYYQQLGYVEVTPMTLPHVQPNIPGFMHHYLKRKSWHQRRHEQISHNDCLYRNIYRYNYVAVFDIDEMIMPKKDPSWNDLMHKRVNQSLAVASLNESYAAIRFTNVFFTGDTPPASSQGSFDTIPRYMHMALHLRATYVSRRHAVTFKSFHNTERALTVDNHTPIACLGKECTFHKVNMSLAHLAHYRSDCDMYLGCASMKNHTYTEAAVLQFQHELIQRTSETLHKLGFFNP